MDTTYGPYTKVASQGQTDFVFAFDVLASDTTYSTVRVYVDDVLQTQGVEYTIPVSNTVRFSTAMSGGERVWIERSSDGDERPTDWADSSPITEYLHDLQDNYSLYVDQEIYADRGLPRDKGTFGWTAADPVTGDPLVIGNAGDPAKPLDVVNLRTLNSRLGGGNAGEAGVWRVNGTGDGLVTEVTLVTDTGSRITDKNTVLVFYDGDLRPVDTYEISSNGRGVVFDDPIPSGVYYSITAATNAISVVAEGGFDPSSIALTDDYIITGNASGFGEPIARSSVSVSDWGAPTVALDMASYKITSLAAPTTNSDAATKKYVDDSVASAGAMPNTTGPTPYTIGTVAQNSTDNLMIVTLQMERTRGEPSDNRQIEIRFADDAAMSTNRKTQGRFKIATNDTLLTTTVFIPPGKYYSVVEITGRNMSGYDFYLSTGSS